MLKSIRRKMQRAIVAASRFAFEPLEARTLLSAVSWINPYSGDWDTAKNWSTNAVPDATSDVYIDQPGYIVITAQGSHSVASVTVVGDTLKISGGSLAVAGAVNNNGIMALEFAAHVNIAGSYSALATAQLTLASGSGSALSAGAISNSGKITVGAADTLTVSGNYAQASNGDLTIELAGSPASNQFGKVNIAGSAALSGKWESVLGNGYSPAVGDAFTVMNYSSESGAFGSFQVPSNSWYAFGTDLNPTSVVLTALSPNSPTTTIKVGAVLHPVVTDDVGVNLGWWDPQLTTAQTQQLVQAAGLKLIRFPGGSSSDAYHFNVINNYRSNETNIPQFAKFIENVGAEGMVTIDYGSGSPQEAEAELGYLLGSPADNTVIGTGIEWNGVTGAWQNVDWKTVGYWASLRASSPLAVDDGLNFMRISHASPFSDIKYWEVGNELYGGWEIDHHGTNLPDGTSTGTDHDPVTYVTFAAAFSNFVATHAANFPSISIGIDSWDPAGILDNNWTSRVLSNGKNLGFTPGFISDHSYMQSPFSESDDNLLNHTISDPTTSVNWTSRFGNYQTLLSQTLGTKGSGVQVMATEYNSDIVNPGKQLSSLINGLFLADAAGTLLNSGYAGGIVWNLRDFWNTTGNNSGSLYGWRQGGDYGLLGDSNYSQPPSTGAYIAYPSYWAQLLASKLAQPGGQVVSSSNSNGQFSSYAVMQANGHLTLLLINKNGGSAVNEQIKIAGFAPGSQANVYQYGITQDNAQSLTSDGASALASFSTALSVAGGAFNYALPAYSMTVLDLTPASAAAAPTIATPAAITPGPVPGTTAALSVLGAIAAGESNLTYAWTASSIPVGAPAPTFSENETNHAKNTTVTFRAAGVYTFTATIRTPGGISVSSSVNVIVNATLTQISVSRNAPNVATSGTVQLISTALDQFGNALVVQPAITWSVTPGGAGGSVNAGGVYTAPAAVAGVATLAATSGAIQGTATINVIGSGPVYTVDFANGFAGAGSSLVLNSVAAIRGTKLVMIDDGFFQASSAFAKSQVNVTKFSTTFGFHLNNAWPMGHGFAFVIQNASPIALGAIGDGMGYSGIDHSVAIKFDMFQSGSGNGTTGLFTNGAWPSPGIELGQNGFSLRSWDPSQASITYDGTTLTVVLTDLYSGASDTRTYTVNIPSVIGSNTAWVGFTAGSAALTTAQSITSWTYTNTVSSAAAPATPTGVSATPGNAQATVTWNAVAGASSYTVSQSSNIGGPYINVSTVSGTSVPISGLTNGQTYYFEVFASNAGGSSLPSTPANVTPLAPPAAPTGLTGVPGNAQVTLSWNFTAGALSYTVAKSSVSGGPYTTVATGIAGTNYSVTNLTNGQPYYFVVYAVNGSGNSAASIEATGTPAAVPATPTGLAAVASNALVTLNWNAAAGATTYTLKYGPSSGNYTTTLANITGTSAAIALANETPYFFVVLAANGVGNSGTSSEASATPSNAPPVVIRIVDDNDTGFAKVGNWGTTFEAGIYFNGDHSFAKSGNGADFATYTFTGLIPGIYKVSATWRGDTNRATATPFTIADGGNVVGSVTINQQLSPASFSDQGSAWGNLGSFSISGSTMVVTIRDTADASLYVDADAIRIERTGSIVSGPVLQVLDAGAAVASGSTINLGSTTPGTPVQHTFTVTNGGTTALTLGAITLPAGYSLAANFGTTSLAFGASTTFKVQMDAAAIGTFSGTLSFTTNDAATPTFSLTLTGSAAVAPPPAVIQFIDDNDAGFAKFGNWGTSVEPGRYYGNDHSFAKSGNGADYATYTFTGLTPGVYRVSATWRGDTNRATAAPFTIADGATVVGNITINQQQQPASFTDAGSNWGDLGTFNLTGTTLVVTIRDTNDASLYVDSDAIRIQRTGDLGFVPPPPNPVFIVDDRSTGWSSTGSGWGNTVEPGRYYGEGHSFAIGGHGNDTATWTFTGLSPGHYRVSATWRADTNRATNAPFTILDGATSLGTVIINQQNAPSSLTDQGLNWTDLGGPYLITGSTLTVRLTDNADLYVDADAIRIERIGD